MKDAKKLANDVEKLSRNGLIALIALIYVHSIRHLSPVKSCNVLLNKSSTCQTPTQALAIKMSKITKGSTKAVIESSSSKKARTYRK